MNSDETKDPIVRAAHLVIVRGVYYRYRENDYFENENSFYGEIFSKINTDAISFSKSQQVFANIIQPLKLEDKDLFITEIRTDHSKINEKVKETPQITEQTSIPYTQGAYGRAQILKQRKQELKSFERDITKRS